MILLIRYSSYRIERRRKKSYSFRLYTRCQMITDGILFKLNREGNKNKTIANIIKDHSVRTKINILFLN